MKHISNGVGWRGVQPEWCMMVLLAAACTALAPTVRHASPRHERDPLPGGLTTPFRAAQHRDQQAGRPCDQQAGRPHCAVGLTTPFRATQHRDQQAGRPCDQQAGRPHCAVGVVETASPSVQTPRTQLGGDGDSLEEKVEQAAPPNITQRHVQGDAPQPPKQSRISTRPAPHSARPLTAQPPSPPTWELPPSLPHPPVAKTYLPEPTAVRCTGLRAGARVSKRASAPGSSFRTHAGNTSTVDSVLGLPVFVVPYIKAHFCTLGVGELHSRRVPSGGGKRGTTWRQI